MKPEHGTEYFCGGSKNEVGVHAYVGSKICAMPCPGGGNPACVGWLVSSAIKVYDSVFGCVRTAANNCDMACSRGRSSVCVGPFALKVLKIIDSIFLGVRQAAMYERYRILL